MIVGLCVQRTVLPGGPSEMVARVMTMRDHEERGGGLCCPHPPPPLREPYEESGGGLCCPHPPPPLREPYEDLSCISTTYQYLHTSGWYWGSISAGEAGDALLKVSIGTFLVRDSSHPLYMLTLSVKTRCGPTNVRIKYSHGRFRLDSVSSGALPRPQSFPDILSLVQHYVGFGERGQKQRGEGEGSPPGRARPLPARPAAKDSPVLLKLTHPLHRPQAFPCLQHLTRLAINRHTDRPGQLPLPRPLVRYLQEYPFQV